MNSLGHFLIGYVICLIIILVITKYFPNELKYWPIKGYIFLHQFVAATGGVIAVFPDVPEIFGMQDRDTEVWTNLYFYHYNIDSFYHSLSGNVRIAFEILPIVLLGLLAALLNFWALRHIISHKVKANLIGHEVCRLATEYVGGVGPIIVNNICSNAGYSLKEISKNEAIELTDSIGEALGAFTGKLMAKEIEDEINRITPVPVFYQDVLSDDGTIVSIENNTFNTNFSHEVEAFEINYINSAGDDAFK